MMSYELRKILVMLNAILCISNFVKNASAFVTMEQQQLIVVDVNCS